MAGGLRSDHHVCWFVRSFVCRLKPVTRVTQKLVFSEKLSSLQLYAMLCHQSTGAYRVDTSGLGDALLHYMPIFRECDSTESLLYVV